MYLSVYLIYVLHDYFQMLVEIVAFSSLIYKNLATYSKHAKFNENIPASWAPERKG